ncbi:hypothetical protein SKAU_G00214730 [Synaphobranchus kaupii]|uniref:Uncharacterized protein n=1 Tax=Synaphobranchus kaupii TaxID=118154 RepID=A0A9Q1F9L0_SYNKA|nr:hypothetical protein SKAU_G00214730 [Synaphobranchus kaupii]
MERPEDVPARALSDTALAVSSSRVWKAARRWPAKRHTCVIRSQGCRSTPEPPPRGAGKEDDIVLAKRAQMYTNRRDWVLKVCRYLDLPVRSPGEHVCVTGVSASGGIFQAPPLVGAFSQLAWRPYFLSPSGINFTEPSLARSLPPQRDGFLSRAEECMPGRLLEGAGVAGFIWVHLFNQKHAQNAAAQTETGARNTGENKVQQEALCAPSTKERGKPFLGSVSSTLTVMHIDLKLHRKMLA